MHIYVLMSVFCICVYVCVCYLSLASVFTRAYSRRRDDGIHLFFSARAKLRPPKPNMAEKPKRTN